MTKGRIAIILIIMVLVTVIVVTALEYTEKKVELEKTKQELAECKADELEIYPCSFCGSEDVRIVDMFGNGTDCYVRCQDCCSSGPAKNPNTDNWHMSKVEAIELWNASYK